MKPTRKELRRLRKKIIEAYAERDEARAIRDKAILQSRWFESRMQDARVEEAEIAYVLRSIALANGGTISAPFRPEPGSLDRLYDEETDIVTVVAKPPRRKKATPEIDA